MQNLYNISIFQYSCIVIFSFDDLLIQFYYYLHRNIITCFQVFRYRHWMFQRSVLSIDCNPGCSFPDMRVRILPEAFYIKRNVISYYIKQSSQRNTPAVVHPFMNSVHSQNFLYSMIRTWLRRKDVVSYA